MTATARRTATRAVITTHVPGIAAVLAIAAGARLTAQYIPLGISEVTVGLLIGLAIANTHPLPADARPGVKFSSGTLLRLAIVFLGARLSLGQVLQTGGGAVLVVVIVALGAIGLTLFVARAVRVAPRLATLLGVGIGICGNSAIVATAPLIEAEEAEIALAVATITLFGTVAILVYPVVGRAIGLSDHQFGLWAGMAINDTSQVTAAGFAFSAAAGSTATIVKLTRNTLLGPLLVAIGSIYVRASGLESAGRDTGLAAVVRRSVPPFVVGFLVLAGLNSLGLIPAALQNALAELSKWFILMALVGIGLGTDLRRVRALGIQPMLVGLIVEGCLALTALALIVGLRL